MIRCEDIARWFDGNWPESLACEWDNVGLLAGRRDREVQKVYIALDATEEILFEARQYAGQRDLENYCSSARQLRMQMEHLRTLQKINLQNIF